MPPVGMLCKVNFTLSSSLLVTFHKFIKTIQKNTAEKSTMLKVKITLKIFILSEM